MQLLQLSKKNRSNRRKNRESTTASSILKKPNVTKTSSETGKTSVKSVRVLRVFLNVTEWKKQRIAKLKSLRSYAKKLQETESGRGKFSIICNLYCVWLIIEIVRTALRSRKIVPKPDDSNQQKCDIEDDDGVISNRYSFKKKRLNVHLGKSKVYQKNHFFPIELLCA